jgi:hypothetical protein
MKKFIFAVIGLIALGSTGFADSFGVRLGFPLGIQYNTFDPGQGTGFRASLNTFIFRSTLQGDYIFGRVENLADINNLSLYYGGGLHVGIWNGSNTGPTSFFGGVQATTGVEYIIQPGVSAFVDLGGAVSYFLRSKAFDYYAALSAGVNFKF